jgi:acyl-CoA thioester hydrolase
LLAAIAIEYVAQGYYPGEVEIGSGVARIGRTSFAVAHAAFQNGRCIALAESRMVKALGGRPEPLNEAERSASRGLMLARAAG